MVVVASRSGGWGGPVGGEMCPGRGISAVFVRAILRERSCGPDISYTYARIWRAHAYKF